jgi:uncharacterized protein (TIGR02246 family)
MMGTDEQAIRELNSTWMDKANAVDLDYLLTLITDDVVLMGPGEEPIGREGFIGKFSGAHEELQIHCSSEMEEVVVVGEVAYSRCRDVVTVTPRDGGETTKHAGYRMTVYRKQADGRWLLARDAHTVV